MNHTSWAGSPQGHVKVDEGCPVHTCHHNTIAGTVNKTIQSTWRPIAKRTRVVPVRPWGDFPMLARCTTAGSVPAASDPSRFIPGRSPFISGYPGFL